MFLTLQAYHLYALPHLLLSLLILAIGIYRIIKSFPQSIPFSIFCFLLFIWNVGITLNFFSNDNPFDHLYRRFYYVGICFFPVAFYYYSISFLNFFTRATRIILWSCVGISSLLFIATLTDFYFIIGSYRYYFGYYARFGWLGWVFLFYAAGLMISTFFMWIHFLRKESDPVHQQRIRIIALGLLLYIPTTIDFLPAIGIPIYPFGILFSVLFILFQNHAVFTLRIVQLQTMSGYLLQQSIVITLTLFPWGVFSFLFFRLFKSNFMDSIFLFAIILFILLIPYCRIVLPWVNRKLFHRDYTYQTLLQNFLHEIYHLKTMSKLTDYIQKIFKKTLQIKNVHLVYRESESKNYSISLSPESTTTCPPDFLQLLPWFAKNDSILFRYDVNTFPEFTDIRPIAEKAFACLDAQLCIPLVNDETVLGIIIIGEKTKHSFFNYCELDFLNRLQKIATLALNNSFLYEHIRQLGKSLWDGNVNLSETVKYKTQALETALEHMKILNEEQANFFTMASHNLRTPLTSIKASATLLWGELEDNSIENNDLEIVLHNNIRRLEMLIRYIIEIVKMDDGKQEFIDGSAMIFSSVKNTFKKDS